jgi:hypothetical protein
MLKRMWPIMLRGLEGWITTVLKNAFIMHMGGNKALYQSETSVSSGLYLLPQNIKSTYKQH